ncbi:50S ribosomal protein L11 methyltransferase [Melghirimyces algeriensis]|uniref:Ribosomal protein L11 methyltransferase n=1 Tax=Melghirimyces algeriensis TaxID=910412 RepID=A0A521BV00_9BACL|nr:50S ribosomal protein L11 methyltransferase [Melghirimyces algeriensis]SMO50491.1 ribosomal protein L11 methyltransferase [Melghirimyces algeriensis]
MEVRIHTSKEAEEAVSHLFLEAGAEGTAVMDSSVLTRVWDTPFGELIELSREDYPDEGIWISGYFPEEVFRDALVGKLEKQVKDLDRFGLDPGPAQVMVDRISQESWDQAWKAYYKPIRISTRLTVKPQWEAYQPSSEEEVVIELDPGMAFGTGSHPTTRLSLKLIEKHLRIGQRVMDIGCGSGILSIASAKLGASDVLALDLDELAVEKTKQNVRLNHLQDQIRVRQGDLLQGVNEKVDLVVSNILAEIIVKFVPDLPKVIKKGSMFIGSGIISAKKEEVVAAIQGAGLEIVETIHEQDWVAIAARS